MNRMFFVPVSISFMQLRKWIKKPEVYMTMICLGIFAFSRVLPIYTMIGATGVDATPYLFPFLFSDSYMGFFILVGCAILFVEAPFWSEDQIIVLVRVGRSGWFLGQIYYVLFASFVYLVGVLIISILVLAPNLQFANTWGSLWNTIAQTDAAMEFNMNLTVPYYIISRYSPLEAMIVQFILGFFVISFIGFLFFFLNLYFGRKTGVVVVSIMILFTIRISSFPEWVFWIFPTAWANLNWMHQEIDGMHPTLYQGGIGLILINIILISLIFIMGRKKDLV